MAFYLPGEFNARAMPGSQQERHYFPYGRPFAAGLDRSERRAERRPHYPLGDIMLIIGSTVG